MKKSIITLFIILVIIMFPKTTLLAKKTYSQILQETVDLQNGTEVGKTTETCMQSDSSGKYFTAKWNQNLGKNGDGREIIGAIYACYKSVIAVDNSSITYKYSGTDEDAARASVQSDVDEKSKEYTIPSCCNWKGDPKKGSACSGDICNAKACSAIKCTSTTSSSGGSGSGSGSGGGGGRTIIRNVSLAQKIALPIPIREFTTYYDIREKFQMEHCYDVGYGSEQICEYDDTGGGSDGNGNDDSGSDSGSGSGSGSSSGGSTVTVTTYTCESTCPNRIITLSDECTDGDREINVPLYDLDIKGTKYDGDPIYCLQPGANGPTAAGLKYILDTAKNIGNCQDQYIARVKKYDSNGNYLETVEENAIQCGLAQILYSSHNRSVDASGKTVWTRKAEYSDGEITLALRLWMAAYAKTPNGTRTYSSKVTNPTYKYVDSEGIEDPDDYNEYDAFNTDSPIAWVPQEDYYDKTATKIKNGHYNSSGKFVGSDGKVFDTSYNINHMKANRDVIHCAEGETTGSCAIDKAIKLFNEAENVSKDNYLGGIDFSLDVPVVQYEVDTGIFEIKFDNRDIVNRIKEECQDVNDPDCKLEVRLFSTTGEDVTDKKADDGENIFEIENLSSGSAFCEKNSCIARIVRMKEYCTQGGYADLKLVIIFKDWSRNYGYVRLYTVADKSPADDYQKMVSFGIKQEDCESESSEYRDGRIVEEIKIPCNCSINTCTDLSAKEEGGGVCANYKNIKDANMNCIVNSCENDVNNEFNVTAKYGFNDLVCTVYERDENKLYLPGITTVYSGMQFSYDLANELNSTLKLSNEHKITGVAMQKKQFTSQINYNYWEKEYIRKQNLLYYSYLMGYSDEYKSALKNEINSWINDLKNCNMVSTGKTTDSIYKINSDLNNIESCTSDSCINLNVKYSGTGTKKSSGLYDGDANYGNVGRLAVHTIFNDAELKDSSGNSYRKYYNVFDKKFETSSISGKTIPLNMYYCKNSSSTECYKYEENNEVEIMMGNTNGNQIRSTYRFKRYTNLSSSEEDAGYSYLSDTSLRQYNCSGNSCSVGTLTIPQNDYVTLIYNIENDYYNNKSYKVEAYTGKVVEGALSAQEQKELNKGSAKFVPLDKYVYPISINSKTGQYPIYFTFTNIKNKYRKNADGTALTEGSKYNGSCYYNVYNRTTSYDCQALDNNGVIDLSKCQDTNYSVENGVPKIEGFDQIKWTDESGNLQYGYVFRSVDLDNLFPNGLEGLNSAVNWSDAQDTIKSIEDSADSIFSDDKYLEYSYTITPQGVKEIKAYNDNHMVDGGYLNATLINCDVEEDETGLKKFTKCTSTFLEEVRGYAGVTVNKDGEVQ